MFVKGSLSIDTLEKSAYQHKTESEVNLSFPLPRELLERIFIDQTVKQQQKMSYVCKQFRKVGFDLENNRVMARAIKKALGNLAQNIRPDTGLIQELAVKIFDIAKLKFDKLEPSLRLMLNKTWQLGYPSWQNHVIDILVAAWDNQGDERTFLNLLKTIYDDEKCTNANRLHLLRLTDKGMLFEKYAKECEKFVLPLNDPKPEVQVRDIKCPFDLKDVNSTVYSSLLISKDNTFQVGEMVAIDHSGSLLGGRKKLFYGIVLGLVQKEDGVYYRVSTHNYDSVWIGALVVSPLAIGKIPKFKVVNEGSFFPAFL